MNNTTPEEYMKRFEELTNQMLSITKAKNHDYSWTTRAFKNFELCENLEVCSVEAGILVRITDKITRISNLISSENQVADEKITDTLLDLANYALILRIYIETKSNQK